MRWYVRKETNYVKNYFKVEGMNILDQYNNWKDYSFLYILVIKSINKGSSMPLKTTNTFRFYYKVIGVDKTMD